MPPKKDNSAGGGSKGGKSGDSKKPKGGDNEDVERNQKLQAILLADSFTTTFRPITWEKPKVLLPLVNIPMLDLTLEFLSMNGVEEVFVFCVWHAQAIQDYISSSKWPSVMSIQCVHQTSCTSAGDALRDIDTRGLIHSDPFILISGDVISNMNLKKAIEFHTQRRKEDSNCVMTVVMKPIQTTTRAQSVLDDLVVGVDKNTSQIVFFENDVKSKSARIPLEIMTEHPAVTFRTDLLDCHVDICSPDLLVEFSDNFDYLDIRSDFIRNQAVNWEVGKHIYSYPIQNEYAARVLDPRTYHAICRDIVTRWVYPIVPDANIAQDGSNYTHLRRYVYKEQGVRVNRSAIVGEGVVMGAGTNIESNAHIERTIIGRNVHIGTGANISESHIWANARIEAGANVVNAIICDGVVVKKGARVGRGCILSYGVVIGAGVLLPDFTRVSLTKTFDSVESSTKPSLASSTEAYDTHILGPDGVGFVWTPAAEVGETKEIGRTPSQGQGQGQLPIDTYRAQSMGCTDELQWKRNLWRNLPKPHYDDDDDDDEDDDCDDYNSGKADQDGFGDASLGIAVGGNSNKNGDNDDDDDDDDDDAVGDDNDDNEGGGQQKLSKLVNSCDVVYSQHEYVYAEPALHKFYENVFDMVLSGRKGGHAADNTLLEIKGYKFAQNKTFENCLNGAIPAVLLALSTADASDGRTAQLAEIAAHLKVMLSKKKADKENWGYCMLRGLIQEKDVDSQVVAIEAVERELVKKEYASNLRPLFGPILQLLYTSDLVSEDAILDWADGQTELVKFVQSTQFDDSDQFAEFAVGCVKLYQSKAVQDFVAWIQAEDEDDDDDDEDGDDEGDDEDDEEEE